MLIREECILEIYVISYPVYSVQNAEDEDEGLQKTDCFV
jgi:hypothetical protein